jgi:ankyrin repeat protein
MSSNRPPASQLPAQPNLRHLKDQAKDLVNAGKAPTLSDAQFQIAQHYGFASWPKLKQHIESLTNSGKLKQAITANDLAAVRQLIVRYPDLKTAPIGYGNAGPLTWAAECRGPATPPMPERLAIAEWLIANGSDVHQNNDAPLSRASLFGGRIPMMELLARSGANVNAGGGFPILFSPCETVEPVAIAWLLEHGADPNCGDPLSWRLKGRRHPGTALDYVLGTYVRDKQKLNAAIHVLKAAGGISRHDEPGVLATIQGDTASLAQLLRDNPSLIDKRFLSLDIGTTAGRMLTLRGATLLHVAAEFGQEEAARLLLESGANANARALIDPEGIGGQTPIFHAATQNTDFGLKVVRLLLSRGADLSPRCRLPGHYEHLEQPFEGTALDYARQFPGTDNLTVCELVLHAHKSS